MTDRESRFFRNLVELDDRTHSWRKRIERDQEVERIWRKQECHYCV